MFMKRIFLICGVVCVLVIIYRCGLSRMLCCLYGVVWMVRYVRNLNEEVVIGYGGVDVVCWLYVVY